MNSRAGYLGRLIFGALSDNGYLVVALPDIRLAIIRSMGKLYAMV